jgi:NAD+ kinase
MKFKRIAIIGKYPAAIESSEMDSQLIDLIKYLSKSDYELIIEEKTQKKIKIDDYQSTPLKGIGAAADIAIIVGGDGTMLGVARNLLDDGIPIIGVNSGRFGFLADLNKKNMFTSIDKVLNGNYDEDRRLLIETKVCRGDKVIYESFALNDIVIKSGVRLIELEVSINDKFVHTQRSDGIIVSTPTGTTAYALSAGGPILHPQLDAISIVPINPHTLSNRPIAINATSEIEIKIVQMEEASLSIDGQIKFPLDIRDKIQVTKAKRTISILHPKDYCYFEMLRNKLHWG